MAEDIVRIERKGAVAVVTLNRPEAMNALSSELRSALAAALRDLDADDEVHVVVLTGAGNRAFSAGLDLKELGNTQGGVFSAVGADPMANSAVAIASCSKPVIGAANGVAVAGGFELALACDILICSDTARFADTHVKVGAIPGWGLSQKLQRVVGEFRAKELAFTGRFLDSATALDWGLVNKVVPLNDLLPEALAMAEAIAAHSTTMVRQYKRLIDQGGKLALGDALAFESAASREFNAAIDAADIEKRRDAVRASNRQ